MTGSLNVRYLAPTPIDAQIDAVAEVVEWSEKKTIVRCELRSGTTVCAEGEVIAIRVPEEMYRQ